MIICYTFRKTKVILKKTQQQQKQKQLSQDTVASRLILLIILTDFKETGSDYGMQLFMRITLIGKTWEQTIIFLFVGFGTGVYAQV